MSLYDSQVHFSGVSMVTATLGTNDPEVGAVCRRGDEHYLFIYNAGGTTISVGNGATVSAVTGYSVTISSIAAVDVLLGVCKHVAIPAASYGWLMTKGFSAIKMQADASGVTGQLLTTALDGTFQVKSISTGFPGATYGKLMESVASGASGQAYVKFY